jgi:4-hydroxy-tetrahydrodipicolinate reductase
MTQPTRIAVVGARGSMGSLACAWVRAAGDLALAAEIDLGDDLPSALRAGRADVALDFTTAAAARGNALAIIEAGARPVIGTSGLGPRDLEEIAAALTKKKSGGLVVPNFSIGAILSMRFAREASRYLAFAEVVEAHHPNKADAPSGTARATAAGIAAARGATPRADASRELVDRVRGGRVDGVPVHSVRVPGIVAYQEIWLGGEGEILRIQHESTDRSCFRDGVLLALRAARRVDGLVVGLDSLLFDGKH